MQGSPFPNALVADFPTVSRSLTTWQASPRKTLTPSLPGLNPCNLGLFLRCLQSAAGPGTPLVTGGTSWNHNTCRGWPESLSDMGAERILIAENVVFGLHFQAPGPGFIVLEAAWL